MTERMRHLLSQLPKLTFALLLAGAALPILFLVVRFLASPAVDLSSLVATLKFSLAAACVSVLVGGTIGALAGTREMPGRRLAIGISSALIAAPPAFWWIGLTRLPVAFAPFTGWPSGSAIAGLTLSPLTLLLVLAATQEIPASVYEAARVSLGPVARLRYVLLPLVRNALVAGFLLTLILLFGESEIPFLFGFRTSMTDIVTTFSQTFDVDRTMPTMVPLIATVLLLGVLAVRPLFAVMFAPARGGHGIVRRSSGWIGVAGIAGLPAVVMLALAGYASTIISSGSEVWRRLPFLTSPAAASIVEPVACAVVATALAVVAAYPLRHSSAIRGLMILGLLLFCVPAAVIAIGWIGVGQANGGALIPPAAAHVSRMFGLSALGFLLAYARVSRSLEDAGRLLAISPVSRAWRITLPLLAPTLAATTALAAALIFADRDVASLLLAPGESRLMLNLYLFSANAPAAVVGAAAIVAIACGATVIAAAALVPLALFSRLRA